MDSARPNKKKKKKTLTPEAQLFSDLTLCSKNNDVRGAVALYETALSQNLRLSQHHCNALLYLCSNSATDTSLGSLAIQCGFRIYDYMISNNINPNEASITSVARLAAAKGDGDYAFDLVKKLRESNNAPKLRTYDPALFCFCEKLQAEKAYEVEEHMVLAGVSLEEPELAALLKVSAETGRGERVYAYLHKLRNTVRCVSEPTAKVINNWFSGAKAGEVFVEVKLDEDKIKDVILMNGGGWHGLGWIGKGRWIVRTGNIDSTGQCLCCGDQLACVDIDDAETEKFAQSVAGLAMEREVKANFRDFQDWLEKHSNYEAIVDGANIGLYQQNFADGAFSVSQLGAVVRELYERSGKKWPLVVLHQKRLRVILEDPSNRSLVEEWMDEGAIYASPHGSNDDWYWLYAAVKLKCLLVTNDEMRDHIFELLGSSFFLKWKERHQVRYTFLKGILKLQMPPPYSSVIQESEKGSWHVPVEGNDSESARNWLCISRSSSLKDSDEVLINVEPSKNGQMASNGSNGDSNACQDYGTKSDAMTSKRKERSPSQQLD